MTPLSPGIGEKGRPNLPIEDDRQQREQGQEYEQSGTGRRAGEEILIVGSKSRAMAVARDYRWIIPTGTYCREEAAKFAGSVKRPPNAVRSA